MLALALTAELTGITSLLPTDTADSPYHFTFRVQCTSCRETHANWITLNRHETHPLSGSRGDAHFVWRCKNCKREASASFTTTGKAGGADATAAKPYVLQEPAKQAKIVEFDCRGCEFVEFKADGEFEATGVESGTKFTGIDLSEGEWFDYDEKAGEEVSIKDIKWEIKRA